MLKKIFGNEQINPGRNKRVVDHSNDQDRHARKNPGAVIPCINLFFYVDSFDTTFPRQDKDKNRESPTSDAFPAPALKNMRLLRRMEP